MGTYVPVTTIDPYSILANSGDNKSAFFAMKPTADVSKILGNVTIDDDLKEHSKPPTLVALHFAHQKCQQDYDSLKNNDEDAARMDAQNCEQQYAAPDWGNPNSPNYLKLHLPHMPNMPHMPHMPQWPHGKPHHGKHEMTPEERCDREIQIYNRTGHMKQQAINCEESGIGS